MINIYNYLTYDKDRCVFICNFSVKPHGLFTCIVVIFKTE